MVVAVPSSTAAAWLVTGVVQVGSLSLTAAQVVTDSSEIVEGRVGIGTVSEGFDTVVSSTVTKLLGVVLESSWPIVTLLS